MINGHSLRGISYSSIWYYNLSKSFERWWTILRAAAHMVTIDQHGERNGVTFDKTMANLLFSWISPMSIDCTLYHIATHTHTLNFVLTHFFANHFWSHELANVTKYTKFALCLAQNEWLCVDFMLTFFVSLYPDPTIYGCMPHHFFFARFQNCGKLDIHAKQRYWKRKWNYGRTIYSVM